MSVVRRVPVAAVVVAAVLVACTSPVGPTDGTASRTTAAPLPEPRTEVAGAAWQGRVVVAGGLRRDGTTSTRVDWWDPGTDSWAPLPVLPVPLHHTALAVLGGDLWVLGGFRPADGGWAPEGRTWHLAPGGDRWEPGPDLLLARGAPAAVAQGAALWVLGGVGHGGTQVATEVLEAGADGWQPGPSLAAPREHLAAALAGGRPIAIAGRDGGLDTNLLSTEVVAARDRMDVGPDVRVPRGGIGAATVAGTPCVAGGEAPGGTIGEVECLRDGTWEVVAELAEPRHGLAVVVLDDRLHVVAGGPEPGLTVSDTHEVLAVTVPPTTP